MAQEAPVAAVAEAAKRPTSVPVAEGSVIGAPSAVNGPSRAEKTTVTVSAATVPTGRVAIEAIIMARVRTPGGLVAFPGRRGPFPTRVLIPEPAAPPSLVLPGPLGPSTSVGEAASLPSALTGEGARARRGLLALREGDTEIEPTSSRMAAAILPS